MLEVVLNQNKELLQTMLDCGILDALVDVFSSESDSETLV